MRRFQTEAKIRVAREIVNEFTRGEDAPTRARKTSGVVRSESSTTPENSLVGTN